MRHHSKFIRSQNNMKVIVAIILAIGSVSSLGSGPYLPSGWRPQGQAFYLPGEVQKPADNPIKETIVFESEASGSDALREYGPPKVQEESLNIIQDLPDVVTEQTFLVVEDTAGAVENLAAEVNIKQKSEAVQEATTEAQLTEEQATEIVERLADIELQQDISTSSYETEVKEDIQATVASAEVKEDIQATVASAEVKEDIQATVASAEVKEDIQATIASEEVKEDIQTVVASEEIKEDVQAIVASEEVKEDIQATLPSAEIKEEIQNVASVEKLEQIVEVEEKTVEDVKNIAETLVQLENEIRAEQVAAVETSAEVKINQEGSGSAEAFQGFLEYGPPGFREYGPPKGDELQKSTANVQESEASFENNEARRRRFSPKFSASKSKRHH